MTNDFLLHIGKKLKIFEYDLVKKKNSLTTSTCFNYRTF